MTKIGYEKKFNREPGKSQKNKVTKTKHTTIQTVKNIKPKHCTRIFKLLLLYSNVGQIIMSKPINNK